MKDISNKWNRRKFLSATTSAGSLILLSPFTSWGGKEQSSEVAKIISDSIGIDTHNHMDVPFETEKFSAKNYDLASQLNDSGLKAICMTFCVDRPNLTQKGEAYKRFLTTLDEMDEMLIANKMERILNSSDLNKIQTNKKPFVVQSVEGAHFVEGELERIKIAYDRGLRHLGLMHDNQTTPPVGDIYTELAQFGGLTDYGIELIKECNKNGILVDLTHCSNKAINDALEVSEKPMIISHTGLDTRLGNNEKMAKMMLPRLISKEQAKMVANAEGLIGVWTHLADTVLEYAQNIRALVDVVGVDHVCIGTDTKMAPPANNNSGFGQSTNESLKDLKEGFYYSVVEAMLHLGFSKNEIIQIGGGNYWRIFENATTIG